MPINNAEDEASEAERASLNEQLDKSWKQCLAGNLLTEEESLARVERIEAEPMRSIDR